MKTTLTAEIAKWQAGYRTDNELVKICRYGFGLTVQKQADGSYEMTETGRTGNRTFLACPDMHDGYVLMLSGYPEIDDPLAQEIEA